MYIGLGGIVHPRFALALKNDFSCSGRICSRRSAFFRYMLSFLQHSFHHCSDFAGIPIFCRAPATFGMFPKWLRRSPGIYRFVLVIYLIDHREKPKKCNVISLFLATLPSLTSINHTLNSMYYRKKKTKNTEISQQSFYVFFESERRCGAGVTADDLAILTHQEL